MKTEIFSLFDVKAATYGRPIFVPTMAVLVRELQGALKGDDLLAKYPEDFRLFRLGSFDDQSGVVEVSSPQFVCEVSSLREAQGAAKAAGAGYDFSGIPDKSL